MSAATFQLRLLAADCTLAVLIIFLLGEVDGLLTMDMLSVEAYQIDAFWHFS
jgi:hypothetical protein